MTSGPATRLLAAFCALAGKWLASDGVDCEPVGGRFGEGELVRFAVRPPSVRAACLGIASATDDGDGVVLDIRLAAAVIAKRTAGAERDGEQARRLADRIAFELVRPQAWAKAVFSAKELDAARDGGPRGQHVGDPRDIRTANLYSGEIDGKGIAIWAVIWLQPFRAIGSDFDLPLPAGAGIPGTVRTGRDPAIGPGHEGAYETVVAPEGGG